MDFQKDIELVLAREGVDAIKRHALVSTRHNCNCGDCFCCACVDWLRSASFAKTKHAAAVQNNLEKKSIR